MVQIELPFFRLRDIQPSRAAGRKSDGWVSKQTNVWEQVITSGVSVRGLRFVPGRFSGTTTDDGRAKDVTPMTLSCLKSG